MKLTALNKFTETVKIIKLQTHNLKPTPRLKVNADLILIVLHLAIKVLLCRQSQMT
jgi:hypothetical protein